MPNRILVTGATGFLGRRLVRELVREGYDVVYTYRSEHLHYSDARGIKINLTKQDDYYRNAERLKDVTHLVHAAAVVSHNYDDMLQDMHDQVTDSVESFSLLMHSLPQLKRMVYIGSGSAALVDSDPTFYALGKLLMEGVVSRVAQARGIPYVILRYPQLFGPGESHGIFITKFLEAIRNGATIQLANDGAVSKDVLYIDDAVGSTVYSLQDSVRSGLYTITMEQPCTVKDVLGEIARAVGKKPRIQHIHVPGDEARSKSFHLRSTASEMGYHIRYDLRQGIENLVRETEMEKV